jgi:hypothetical protein
MPTEKQIDVNRLNACKHDGLTGHLDVMTEEQKQAHDSFIAEITDDLKPVGAFERQLAHSIAETQWRINRVAVIENNIFASDAYNTACNQEAGRAEEADPALPGVDHALAPARTFIGNPERFHLLALDETRLHRSARPATRAGAVNG